jgi:hypothetical protein
MNITKRFLSAVGLDLLTAETNHFFGRIKIPKRRKVIGLDRGPWTPSSNSLFTIKPIDIGAKFLMVAGFPLMISIRRPLVLTQHTFGTR